MRNITLIGIIAGAATLVLAQAANAERVCRSVCDGGTCVQKCVENEDRVIVDHDRAPPPRGPGVDIHAPGVNVDVK
jgi:hypothetical protein